MNERQRAIAGARVHLQRRPIYLDTETTGPDGYVDEIVEIGVVDDDRSVLINTLVRPRRPIPHVATAVHGITNEMVGNAPTWGEVWPRVQGVLHQREIGIYSVGFDLNVLRGCTVRAGLPWRQIETAFCIMKLYAAFRGEPKDPYGNPAWHRLETAARACDISISAVHRALDDALLARGVLHYIGRAGS
jgi:DNA polymerase-3 subunit epsilon